MWCKFGHVPPQEPPLTKLAQPTEWLGANLNWHSPRLCPSQGRLKLSVFMRPSLRAPATLRPPVSSTLRLYKVHRQVFEVPYFLHFEPCLDVLSLRSDIKGSIKIHSLERTEVDGSKSFSTSLAWAKAA